MYLNIDIRNSAELLRWQRAMIDTICVNQLRSINVTQKLKHVTSAQIQTLENVERKKHQADMTVDVCVYLKNFSYINMKTDLLY